MFNETTVKDSKSGFKGSTKATDPNILLARILQYLECPQYLRKHFFPKHPDLNYAGKHCIVSRFQNSCFVLKLCVLIYHLIAIVDDIFISLFLLCGCNKSKTREALIKYCRDKETHFFCVHE